MNITSWEQLTQPDCPAVFTPDQLRQARELRGWSQNQLAAKLGRQRQVVNKWENGRQAISRIDTLAVRFVVVYHDVV